MKTGPKPRPTIDRMMEKMSIVGDCWLFTGAIGSQGYGKTYHNGRATDAHRASYASFIGEIPSGMCVCHSCDVKLCFNPDHLFLGTQADNLKDMHEKNRHAKGSALSLAIKAGWTDKLRLEWSSKVSKSRKEQYRQRQIKAGVPFDWKYCGKSTHWLPRSAFTKNSARQDGLNSYCRECRVLTNRIKH